jgi:hypothetical protein
MRERKGIMDEQSTLEKMSKLLEVVALGINQTNLVVERIETQLARVETRMDSLESNRA